MKRITLKQAAQMMECGEQQVRMMVQLGKIPGAFCTGSRPRRTYYIYDEQIEKLKMGTRYRQAGADALIGTWQNLSEFQQIGLCGGCDNSNGKLSDDGDADRSRVHPEIKGRGKNMNELKELLEVRRAILREHIALDKGCYNDPFLSQHSRGRVAVEEKWLEETEKLLDMVEKLNK